MSSVVQQIGAEVRLRRRACGLSLAGLSAALKAQGLPLDSSALSRVESGQRDLRFSEVLVLADVLGFRLDQFQSGAAIDTAASSVRDSIVAEMQAVLDRWADRGGAS